MTRDPKASHSADLPLDRIAPGGISVIRQLNGAPSIVRRIMELGLVPGTRVEVIRLAPLGDPVELRVRDVHLSIRRSEAAHILVRPV